MEEQLSMDFMFLQEQMGVPHLLMQVQVTQIKTYPTVSLDNVVTRVPSEDVEFIWSQVAPLLEKALDEKLQY